MSSPRVLVTKHFLSHAARQSSCTLINVKFKMLKFKSAQGLFRIISAMNHLCREAVNCWVLGVHSAWGGFQEEREAPQCQQSDNNNNNHAAHMFTWNAHIVEMRAVNVNYHFNLLFSSFSAESAQTVYVNDFVPMESAFKCIFLCLSRHTNRKQEDERQNNYLKFNEWKLKSLLSLLSLSYLRV